MAENYFTKRFLSTPGGRSLARSATDPFLKNILDEQAAGAALQRELESAHRAQRHELLMQGIDIEADQTLEAIKNALAQKRDESQADLEAQQSILQSSLDTQKGIDINEAKSKLPQALQRNVEFLQQAGYSEEFIKEFINKSGGGSTTVVDIGQDRPNIAAETQAEEQIKALQNRLTGGDGNPGFRSDADRSRRLLSMGTNIANAIVGEGLGDAGAWRGLWGQIAPWVSPVLGNQDFASKAQLASAYHAQAIQLKPPGSGAMSDKDITFITKQIPGIDTNDATIVAANAFMDLEEDYNTGWANFFEREVNRQTAQGIVPTEADIRDAYDLQFRGKYGFDLDFGDPTNAAKLNEYLALKATQIYEGIINRKTNAAVEEQAAVDREKFGGDFPRVDTSKPVPGSTDSTVSDRANAILKDLQAGNLWTVNVGG